MAEKPLGDRRVTDAAGVTFIPASRRADGTWRKEIKVRAGYVPVEEVGTYAPRPAREIAARSTGLPVGLDPADAPAPVVKGRGAAAAAPKEESGESAAARKNARRREKRAAERKAAEEEKLAERLAAVALGETPSTK